MPCETQAECEPLGVCIHWQGEEGSYCEPVCEERECPEGYDCVPIFFVFRYVCLGGAWAPLARDAVTSHA